MRIKLISLVIPLSVFLIILLYTRPFYLPGYFPTHDGEWAIVRLTEMVRELRDLQLPPRWSAYLNHGFGYPLFSFSYPLPYYLGSLLKLIGFSYTGAVKSLFLSSVFASAIFMYLLAKELTGRGGALISSVLYTITPYRLINLYQRGALGESMSLVFFPLIFYLSLALKKKFSASRAVFLSLMTAALLLTHNISALLFYPFFIIFLFVIKLPLKKILFTFFLSLAFSFYFIFPALIESDYLYLSRILLADKAGHFLDFFNLLNMTKVPTPDLYLGLGIWPVILLIFALLLLIFVKNDNIEIRRSYVYFLICLLILIFLTNRYSFYFWQMPLLKSIDFPWRVMTPLIFFASLFTSILAQKKYFLVLSLAVISLVLISNLEFVKINPSFVKNDQYYQTNDATTTSLDELMPLWVQKKPKDRPAEIAQFPDFKEPALYSNLIENSKTISFELDSRTGGALRINKIFYPGWVYYVNGEKTDIRYDNPGGLVTLIVPKGRVKISGQFGETPARLAADLISLSALIYAGFVVFKEKLRNR